MKFKCCDINGYLHKRKKKSVKLLGYTVSGKGVVNYEINHSKETGFVEFNDKIGLLHNA